MFLSPFTLTNSILMTILVNNVLHTSARVCLGKYLGEKCEAICQVHINFPAHCRVLFRGVEQFTCLHVGFENICFPPYKYFNEYFI